jgi:DNA-binding ferritin-like protein (Dps family)
MKYSITVTKNLIFIGCKMFETKKALKITKKQAEELGLPKEYYQAYKEMIKGALRIVK